VRVEVLLYSVHVQFIGRIKALRRQPQDKREMPRRSLRYAAGDFSVVATSHRLCILCNARPITLDTVLMLVNATRLLKRGVNPYSMWGTFV
jgi:hypothetical protein